MRLLLVPLAGYVLLYAPGHWLLRRREPASGATSHLFREVLLSACCTTWIGTLLAELGVFSLSVLLALLGFVTLLGFLLQRDRPRHAYRGRDAVGLAVCLFACVWLAPPFDTRLAAGDSTEYLAGGLHLARHGTLVIHDATLPRISVDLKRSLFPSVAPERGTPPYLRLLGSLILRSLDRDEVLPAFHHSISVWIAVIDGTAGHDAGAWAITLFGGLSVWAIVECATALGASPGLVLPFLLLSAIQYWYSRFLMPEIPGQYFLWAGFACLAELQRSTRTSAAVLAGLAFGMSGMLRFENAIFLLVVLGTGAFLVPIELRRRYAMVLGCALIIWCHAGLHLVVLRTHYFGILQSLLSFGNERTDVTALVIAPVMALLAWRWFRSSRLHAAPWLDGALVTCLLLASFWASYRTHWSSLRLLASSIGVPTLLGGWVGLLLLLRRPHTDSQDVAARLLVLLGAVVWAQVMIAPHAQPIAIWTVRRALTVVLPALCVGVAYLCSAWARRGHWAAAAGLLCAGLAGEAPLFWQLHHGAGFYQQAGRHIDALGTLIEPDATVLVDGELVALGLAPALWARQDLPAYLLATGDAEHIAELVDALDAGPIYWLCRGTQPLPHGHGFELVPVALYEFEISTPLLDVDAPLGAAATWETRVALYRIRRSAPGQKKAPLQA